MASQTGAKPAKQAATKSEQTGKQTKNNQDAQAQSGGYPLDDLAFDLVTVLYQKSKALEAFDKYQQDAQGDEHALSLFEEMRQADEQFVQQLREQLGQRLSEQGQPSSSGQSGKANGKAGAGAQTGSKTGKQSFYSKEDVVD